MLGPPVCVNDVHSRLNRTAVASVLRPRDPTELRAAIQQAAQRKLQVSICGGRHAMGGQQFGAGTLLIDMTEMNRPIRFDAERGLIEMEAGAQWPAVIDAIHRAQGEHVRWSIRQKQTGADSLTLGGAVSANVHGRGLLMGPFVDDVEAFTLVTADGELVPCSREQNGELFRLVVGGYGLFGVIATVTLRLGPRLKLRRLVDILDIDEAIPAVRRRVNEGCLYGDFQYAIDPADESFLRRGVCACYKPVPEDVPAADDSTDLSVDDWLKLLRLAHTDKCRAFQLYSGHYLSTHGRVYWSDTMQLSTYIPSYDGFLRASGEYRGEESLMLGELYVPPDLLIGFLDRARMVLRETGAEDIYSTIRTIQPDTTTFLAWAREHFACITFNLRTQHTPGGIERTARTFRGLIAAAIELGGSFFLTYHRYATREQVEACYPQMRRFLALKREYDPEERFVSEWYRHMMRLFDRPVSQRGSLPLSCAPIPAC